MINTRSYPVELQTRIHAITTEALTLNGITPNTSNPAVKQLNNHGDTCAQTRARSNHANYAARQSR